LTSVEKLGSSKLIAVEGFADRSTAGTTACRFDELERSIFGSLAGAPRSL
jgi:hypothetical protein